MLNNFSHLNLMGRQIGLYFEDPRTFVYFNWLKVYNLQKRAELGVEKRVAEIFYYIGEGRARSFNI